MLTDDDLRVLRDTAATLARPRREPADSFVLHASLELLARADLLARIPAEDREPARERLRWLAATFEAAGDPVEAPDPVEPDADRLLAALRAGDVDEVDRQTVTIGAVATPAELRAVLAPTVVRSLAAAAHGSILLELLVQVAPPARLPNGLARQALREMARRPTWHLDWFDDPDEPDVTAALGERLLDVPRLGLPGSNFIYPIMHQAEESGVAPRLLRGLTHDGRGRRAGDAERDLTRVAAWSMLQEPDEHAPYGWSHCLTMPQATARLADVADHAIDVAATYVVGFRSALSATSIDPGWSPDADADDRVAEAWHHPRPALANELAAFAAAHEDAHLAKYTQACLVAARHDPEMAHLYLAASTRLARFWRDADADAASVAS